MSFLMLVMVGCRSQKQPVVRYYTLEMPVAEMQSKTLDQPVLPYKCEIRNAEINPAFAGNRIANRQASNALIYYGYHEWATRPAEMLTQLTALLVQSQRIFSAVSSRSAEFIPDYTLHIYIYRLETVQGEDAISAHLAVDFQLKEVENSQVVAYYAYDREIPIDENNLNAFASAISDMYEEALREMLKNILAGLENK